MKGITNLVFKQKNKAIIFAFVLVGSVTITVATLDYIFVFQPLPNIPQTGSGIFRSADFSNPQTWVDVKIMFYHFFAFAGILLLYAKIPIKLFSKFTKTIFPIEYKQANDYLESVNP